MQIGFFVCRFCLQLLERRTTTNHAFGPPSLKLMSFRSSLTSNRVASTDSIIGSVALADERTVIVPTDNKPFTVEKDDLVRLTEKGIAGSKIEAKGDGPANVETASVVRRLVGGRHTIGNTVKEFDLKPTGTGKVTVTITVTPPNAGPRVTKIEFDVK